jgi:hypothetical protein
VSSAFKIRSMRFAMLIAIRIVESTDARMFGLDDGEVANRRRYVTHVRREIEVRSCPTLTRHALE